MPSLIHYNCIQYTRSCSFQVLSLQLSCIFPGCSQDWHLTGNAWLERKIFKIKIKKKDTQKAVSPHPQFIWHIILNNAKACPFQQKYMAWNPFLPFFTSLLVPRWLEVTITSSILQTPIFRSLKFSMVPS